MSEIIIRVLISIFILIISISFFIKYKNLTPDETVKIKDSIFFFFALITILIVIWEPVIKKEKLPPDYIRINKPYLETQLIIDEVTDRAIKFHFAIQNIGKLPAENISFNIYSRGSYSYEVKYMYERQLPPNGKMNYIPDLFLFMKNNEHKLILELEIFYTTVINDEEKYYRTLLNFVIPRGILKPGIFEYHSKDEKNEPKPDIDLKFISTHTDSILEGPEGSVFFSFDEKDQHETSISAFYSTPTKEILFDPIYKIIVFKVKLDDRIVVLRESYYKPGITFHSVAVTWNINNKEYFLYVDE